MVDVDATSASALRAVSAERFTGLDDKGIEVEVVAVKQPCSGSVAFAMVRLVAASGECLYMGHEKTGGTGVGITGPGIHAGLVHDVLSLGAGTDVATKLGDGERDRNADLQPVSIFRPHVREILGSVVLPVVWGTPVLEGLVL